MHRLLGNPPRPTECFAGVSLINTAYGFCAVEGLLGLWMFVTSKRRVNQAYLIQQQLEDNVAPDLVSIPTSMAFNAFPLMCISLVTVFMSISCAIFIYVELQEWIIMNIIWSYFLLLLILLDAFITLLIIIFGFADSNTDELFKIVIELYVSVVPENTPRRQRRIPRPDPPPPPVILETEDKTSQPSGSKTSQKNKDLSKNTSEVDKSGSKSKEGEDKTSEPSGSKTSQKKKDLSKNASEEDKSGDKSKKGESKTSQPSGSKTSQKEKDVSKKPSEQEKSESKTKNIEDKK